MLSAIKEFFVSLSTFFKKEKQTHIKNRIKLSCFYKFLYNFVQKKAPSLAYKKMNFKQHKTSFFESNDDLRLSGEKLHFLPLLLS